MSGQNHGCSMPGERRRERIAETPCEDKEWAPVSAMMDQVEESLQLAAKNSLWGAPVSKMAERNRARAPEDGSLRWRMRTGDSLDTLLRRVGERD
jgi:hypothetical protein